MAEFTALYQRAVLYDIVFNRDVSREVDFVAAAYRRFTGAEMKSLLEVACGPGYHACHFARQGGRAVGLDLQPEMVAFAAEMAAARGVRAAWVAGDMRDFRLDAPVDAAICPFDGIDALLTNADLIHHFRCLAANLTPGGLYVLEITHPRDCGFHDYGAFRYSGARDGVSVAIVWATNHPTADIVRGVAHVELEIHVDDHGQHTVIHDAADERFLVPQEIELLAELSCALRIVGWYGDYDLGQALDSSPVSRRMIAVLQKA